MYAMKIMCLEIREKHGLLVLLLVSENTLEVINYSNNIASSFILTF